MKVIKAPNPIPLKPRPQIFLAGSIEMGKAEDWQTKFTSALSDLDVTILNPRRDDWDSSWEQNINNPQFREQVEWELDALTNRADIIAMYFAPETMSPISLLELGLLAKTGRMAVCCPDGFWRKGNVDVVCAKYDIKTAKTLSELICLVRFLVEEKQ